MKFLFLDQDETIVSDHYLNPLRERGTVEIYGTIPEDDDEVVARASEADAIFFAKTAFTPGLIDRLPTLKILQFLGTGVWNLVDVDYAQDKGIKVLNIEGYGNNAVAEYAIGLAFSLARQIPRADLMMRQQQWSLTGLRGVELSSSVFGVLGTGNIGALVAQKASLLGTKVLAHDLYEKKELKTGYWVSYTSLEQLVAEADFLSLHLKTTPQTMGIISRDILGLMKQSACLINVARAELVDNEALYEALKNKRIRGAALDVFKEEPPQDYRFSELDNVITSPHIGFYTDRAVINMLTGCIENVIRAVDQLKNKE